MCVSVREREKVRRSDKERIYIERERKRGSDKERKRERYIERQRDRERLIKVPVSINRQSLGQKDYAGIGLMTNGFLPSKPRGIVKEREEDRKAEKE